ncbi:universal stress protein [Parapedobacter sp. DT-150]|uniref:universal stress protein n=1 Tax=Parapedobacter sp. DT-150 TaxID=3396162 RepID=UPI003F1CF2BB
MQTIIVAADFSESSVIAAQYAASLSDQLGIETIILYHSYDNVPVATEIPMPEPSDTHLTHERSLSALEMLESQIEPFKSMYTRVELVTNDSPLLLGIERLAEQERAGLVVAGTTGKTGMEKFLIGSNSANLADACPIPLLIVPDGIAFEPIRRAVFACDLDKVDKTTPLGPIAEWVSKLDLTLLVLNVEKPDMRFDPDIIPEQFKLHELLDDLSPEYHYTTHPDIAEGIMAFAESQQAGLVITVPKKYGFFDSLFHRSVTKTLAHHTRLPLLILKADRTT